MSKHFHCIVFTMLAMTTLHIHASAQQFRWPREKAYELAGGGTVNGLYFHWGYIRFFQPRSIRDIPFKKRFKSLIGRNKYIPFPCKKEPTYKIPPGLSTKVSFFGDVGSGNEVKYRIIGMDASLLYVIYNTSTLYICLKGGATITNNRLLTPINEGNRLEYHDEFKYGVLGGFEIERMLGIHKENSFIAGWQQYYLNPSDSWGTKRWYAFMGFRFKI